LIDKNSFITEIDKLCSTKSIGIIDAVVLWCDKNSVDIELVAPLIKKDATMKARLQAEAEDLNILKKGARLPV
jgi:hypothetical protein